VKNFNSNFLKKIFSKIIFSTLCFSLAEPALDLFDRMLELDPAKRISASDALESTWLKNLNENTLKPME